MLQNISYSRLFVGLEDGKIVNALMVDVIENRNNTWTELKIPKAGPIHKLVVEENNGYTEGFYKDEFFLNLQAVYVREIFERFLPRNC
jgi:hypothetical protein